MATIIVWLCLIGVGVYCINRFVPMDPKFKTLINIVAIVATILWLLNVFGIVNMGDLHPRR